MPMVTYLAGDWQLLPIHSGKAHAIPVRLLPNLSMRRGTVLGQVRGTTETYGPYSPSAVDGRQVARLLLSADCATDGDGFITLASTVVGQGRLADRPFEKINAYSVGGFACEDLTGLDEQAAAQLGRIVEGTVLRGIIVLG